MGRTDQLPIKDEPLSPCNKVCRLNATEICVGCGRSRDDIATWSLSGAAQKAAICEAARKRLAIIRQTEQGRAA